MKPTSDLTIPDVDILDTVAFVDTLACQIRQRIPRKTFSALKKRYTKKIKITPCKGDHKFQSFLMIHQPDQYFWDWLISIDDKDIRICRIDIAIDLLTRTKEEAKRLVAFFKRHYRQKWQGNKEAHQYGATFYVSRNPRSGRNVAIYGDKLSKTGLGYCAHLELRFTNAERCRAAGLSNPKSLLSGPDVMRLLNHEGELVQLNIRNFERRLENLARKSQRQYGGKKSRRRLKISLYRNMKVRDRLRRHAGVIFRILQTKDNTPDLESLSEVEGSRLGRLKIVRQCLEKTKWEDVIPRPRWWIPPYGKRNRL